jgi:ferredoxin-NADP reductase
MPTEQTIRMKVRSRAPAADGVVHLELEADNSEVHLPAWSPGAHVDLRSDDGTVRQYSLCGDPAADHWEVAVLHVAGGRGGSTWVHDSLTEGATLDVTGPRNHFELEDAPEYLFIAGGIGITPILPMVREVAGRDVPWKLLYGGRTRRSMAFAERLEDEFGDRVVVVPAEDHGLLDLHEALAEEVPNRAVYCCGPEPLLMAVEELMADRGQERLHVERFSAGDVDRGGGAFEVEIVSSGATIPVAEGESIIDALATHGIEVDFSCREGTCGTCETAVLGGVPDHRDAVLAADEKAANDCMMICVGRCLQGPLVLDL